MITPDDLIRGWNNAGEPLNAEFLTLVFKKLETDADVAVHNFMMSQIEERIGPYREEFKKAVAQILTDISLRNLKYGTKKETDR